MMRRCTWATTVFGWVVHVERPSHERQHSRFPSRISHWDGMINFSCQRKRKKKKKKKNVTLIIPISDAGIDRAAKSEERAVQVNRDTDEDEQEKEEEQCDY